MVLQTIPVTSAERFPFFHSFHPLLLRVTYRGILFERTIALLGRLSVLIKQESLLTTLYNRLVAVGSGWTDEHYAVFSILPTLGPLFDTNNFCFSFSLQQRLQELHLLSLGYEPRMETVSPSRDVVAEVGLEPTFAAYETALATTSSHSAMLKVPYFHKPDTRIMIIQNNMKAVLESNQSIWFCRPLHYLSDNCPYGILSSQTKYPLKV